MKKSITTCDSCGRDMANVPPYHFSLYPFDDSEDNSLQWQCPIKERQHHFCGVGCLKKFVDEAALKWKGEN